MMTEEAAQSGLPSFSWTPHGARALVPAAATHLLWECRWVWVSLSWLSNLQYWSRVWVWFRSGAGYQPPPRWKDTGEGGARWNIRDRPTHGLGTEWASVKRYQEIPTQVKDNGWRAVWKMPGNTHPVERYWWGGGVILKKSRNTGISAERCWGRSVVGDWVVLAEWLGNRPILHFSSIRLPL